MKRACTLLLAFCLCLPLFSQEKKIYRGFDGGMMIHSGFLRGTIDPIGYQASDPPLRPACLLWFPVLPLMTV
jgi:hypothetical protein